MRAVGQPKILVVGEFSPGQIGKSFARGFEALGCAVARCSPTGHRPEHVPLNRFTWPVLAPVLIRRWEQALIAEATAASPDVILVTKANWLRRQAIETLRSRTKATVINFYPDGPFHAPNASRALFAALAAYDQVFTFSHAFIPRLMALGAKPSFLPFAWDPEMHPPLAPDRAIFADVSFVGNWSSERAAWLESIANHRLEIWGHWHHLRARSPLRPHLRNVIPYEREMVDAMGRGAINLNLIQVFANGHNMRTFEAPGCGVFVLSRRTPELLDLFAEGEEMACFETPLELREKIRHYLDRPDERARIAEAGHRRCQGETYVERCREILHALGHLA